MTRARLCSSAATVADPMAPVAPVTTTVGILNSVLISAHAGYPRWLDSGADFIEVDIRRDHSGVLVDSHDRPRPGTRYAAYEEILRAAQQRIGLHIDLKETGFEIELVSRALERFAPDDVVVTPDFEESARTIKRHFPEVRVSPIDFVIHDHSYPISFDGRPVWVWTVDDADAMRRYMADQRIECLITNRPDRALRLRTARV
jgi:glycerophosphoryl diester phosphodiesterase